MSENIIHSEAERVTENMKKKEKITFSERNRGIGAM